jgi:site-specific recombinase XerD
MAKKLDPRPRDGQPYVRIHQGHWHLYFRNPDPKKPYPLHRSLRLLPEERRKAETIEAEARLVWKQCEAAFRQDPAAIGKVFERFVADKLEGRTQKEASEALSPYLEKTLGDVLDEFLASKQGRAKRTREHYGSHVKQIRRLMPCQRPVAEVVPEDVLAFLRTRLDDDGIHKRTANKFLGTLRSVFSFAQRREYVSRNSARMVESFSLDAEDKEELTEPVCIPRECYEALLHSKAARSHPPVRQVMFLLYQAGMRIGELLRLRWRDIDNEASVMHVTASPQKGGDRTPYMVSRELRLYCRLARAQAEQAYGANRWGKDVPFERVAVIANGKGGPWGYTNLSYRAWAPFLTEFAKEQPAAYKKLCRAAGIADADARPISFHDFRHTFITDLLVKGVNPIVVGWLVGHKELHTQRRYTHLCYSHFKEEFEGFKR